MKIGGVKVSPNVEYLVLPRPDGDLVFIARSVSVNEEFEKIVPEPTPPGVRTKDGFQRDYKDKSYHQQIEAREEKRMAFMVLKSIEGSDIEWDKVDMDKPETWVGWDKEMHEAGLSEYETNRIVNTVMAANSLDEEKIKAARASFLRGQAE